MLELPWHWSSSSRAKTTTRDESGAGGCESHIARRSVGRHANVSGVSGAGDAFHKSPACARQWSFLLQELSQLLAVESAYEQAMDNLGQILGSTFSVAMMSTCVAVIPSPQA
ncbi:MAG: hypothetical protein RIC55_12430 [Pirellulaceae bacterium]